MRIFYDTSVLVAVTVGRHPQHISARAAFRHALGGRHVGVVSAHGLAETFSTLTRLPLRPMIHPAEAHRYIQETVVRHCEVVALNPADYLKMLDSASRDGLRGGIVYDLLQVQCAEKGGCDRIYTFNLADFLRVAPHLRHKMQQP